MTSKLILDNLAGRTTAGSIAVVAEGNGTTTNLQQGLAKVWMVDETLRANSDVVEDSFNRASATDTATGNLVVAFTNAFATTGYASKGSCMTYSKNDIITTKWNTPTTSQEGIFAQDAGGTDTDQSIAYSAHGDLA